MSTSIPTSDKKAPGPNLRVPPEEKFWKRYSPHGEAPISLAGSFALHALAVGGLILIAVFLVSLFDKPTLNMPVEPVRLDLGGGGGSKTGVGDGKGLGGGPLQEAAKDQELSQPGLDDGARRPTLDQVAKRQVQDKFDPASARYIEESKSEAARAFANLDENVRRKLADGLRPGKGEGGPGEGGGSGTGAGKGTGPGIGDGKASLSKREKRMLRWHMSFTANTGMEYLAQLRGLGAILAIPTREGPDPGFKVVRDLRPGARLLDEDLSKIQRIYWIDDKPRSVADVLAALGVRLPKMPSRFVAFMPETLENELFQMERRYVERVLKVPFDEDHIDETVFRVVPAGGRYRPELVRVTMK